MSCIVLCNDDGIEAVALHVIAHDLAQMGHSVVILAPFDNKSACGMSITLRKSLKLNNHPELERTGVRVFSLDGTPCDCAIAVGDGLLANLGIEDHPRLLISGVNLGPNLSIDALHSGTMAAAREAALYGIPAISLSLTSFDEEAMPVALMAAGQIVEKLLQVVPLEPLNWPRKYTPATNKDPLESFLRGDSYLNVNIPPQWNRKFRSTTLGRRRYMGALSFAGEHIEIGAAEVIDEVSDHGDVDAILAGYASISLLPSPPSQHPDHPPQEVYDKHLENPEGWPTWLS